MTDRSFKFKTGLELP